MCCGAAPPEKSVPGQTSPWKTKTELGDYMTGLAICIIILRRRFTELLKGVGRWSQRFKENQANKKMRQLALAGGSVGCSVVPYT